MRDKDPETRRIDRAATGEPGLTKGTMSGSGGGVQEKKPGRPRKAKSVGIQGGKKNE